MKFQTFYSQWSIILVLPAVLILASCGKAPQAESPVSSPTSVSAASTPKASITSSPIAPTTITSKPVAMASPTPTSGAIASSTAKTEGEIVPEGTACPSNAPIKGKDSKHGKIYHLPQTNNYEQVKPTVCFTDVAAAEKAGYRAPKQP